MTAPAGRGTGEAGLTSNPQQIGLQLAGSMPAMLLTFLHIPTEQKTPATPEEEPRADAETHETHETHETSVEKQRVNVSMQIFVNTL